MKLHMLFWKGSLVGDSIHIIFLKKQTNVGLQTSHYVLICEVLDQLI